MSDLPVWALPSVVAGVGTAIVLGLTYRDWRAVRGPEAPGGALLEMPCTLCRRSMIIHKTDLKPMSGVEVGLVVRSIPETAGRKLAEVFCPHCQAIHCFATDKRPPEWIGVNLAAPEQQSAVCLECRKPLRTPPWAPGTYDGRIQEAPDLRADYGLKCPFCGSLACLRCAQDATRNRTPDGSLMCPRCRRHPVDRFFHGSAPGSL